MEAQTPPETGAETPSSSSSSEIKSQESPVVPMLPKRSTEDNNSSSDTVAMKPISTRVGHAPRADARTRPSNCCILI